MTDRELLELAAKAAGINMDYSYAGRGFDVLGNAVLDWHNGTKWSPLTDDGDALRLAVSLKLTVGEHLGSRHAGVRPCPDDYEDGKYPVRIAQIDGADPYAAARRAIVRAAAEIGKAMP